MLEISFPALELTFTAIWLLARACVWFRQKRIDWKREAVLALMYLNLAVILRLVFFPRGRIDGQIPPLVFDAAAVFPLRVNLIPLVYLLRYGSMRDILWNVTGNAAMFVPSGILLPLVYRRCRSFLKTAAAGALLSLCIEILQLPFPARASDVDDLILNTLGAAAGYGIYAAFRHLKRKPDRVE
ncbi:MAG: VanZ family protein [Oscillospiraceae bacterium]|nr:VanZ family protein [Oscillospiraceae bacterium]